MPETVSSTEVSITQRPDLQKNLFRERLSKTQLHKGTFYKFLMQAGIPFTAKQYIHLPTSVNVDRLLKKHLNPKIGDCSCCNKNIKKKDLHYSKPFSKYTNFYLCSVCYYDVVLSYKSL